MKYLIVSAIAVSALFAVSAQATPNSGPASNHLAVTKADALQQVDWHGYQRRHRDRDRHHWHR
jgi:hypothetical protein